MFLGTLAAVHEPAQVTRGGFHNRPIIHIKLGALTLTCSVEGARELASDLFRVSEAAAPRGAECDAPVAPDCTVTFDRILRGNADLVPAEHATLSPAQSADFEARR